MKAPTALVLFKIHRLQAGTSVVTENQFKWKSPNYTASILPVPVLAVMSDCPEGFKGLILGKAELSALAAELHWTELAASLEIKAGSFWLVFFFLQERIFKISPWWLKFWLGLSGFAGVGSRAGLHWRLRDWSELGVGGGQRYVCANHQNLQEKWGQAWIFIRRSAQPWLCASHDLRTMSLLTVTHLQRGGGERIKVKLCLLRLARASHALWAQRRWQGGWGGGDTLQHQAAIAASISKAQRRCEFWEVEIFILTSRCKLCGVTRSQSMNS